MAARKVPKVVALKRLDEVRDLMGLLYSPARICRIKGKEWGIKPECVQRYIKRIHKEWEEDDQEKAEQAKRRILLAWQKLYERAWASDDLKVCATVLKEVGRTMGVDAAVKVAVQTNSPQSAEAEMAMLRELVEKGVWPRKD